MTRPTRARSASAPLLDAFVEPAAARRFWLAVTVTWVVLAVLGAAQEAGRQALTGGNPDWPLLLRLSFIDWGSCAVFSPLFVAVASRFPLRGPGWLTRLPVHVLAAVTFGIARTALFVLLRPGPPGREDWFIVVLAGTALTDLLTYGAAMAVLHSLASRRHAARRHAAAAALETALRSAELDNLKAQIQPHFLFNTLQAISTLIHRSPAAADRMLTDLSELLRMSLGPIGQQLVPLDRELEFLARYAEIMRTRYPERLTVRVDAAPATLTAAVPSLLLQPLVENAIRHGMAGREGPCEVSVTAARENGRILIRVEDDGNGITSATAEGIGLGNLRARLGRLYDGAAALDWTPRPEGGTRVTITLPVQDAAP